MISATHKRNSEGIWLYKDNRKDAKDHLRKDEAMSLGDIDCLPEMDWRLRETCTLLLKDVASLCLYVSPKTPKTPKDGPAVFPMKPTHQPRTYIPHQWPLPEVLDQLIEKSSGQFIYPSTVIHFVSSIQHKPTDRLDIVLTIHPPQKDLPFVEIDALYTHIFTGVEEIEPVLQILSLLLISDSYSLVLPMIEEFLSLQPGDVGDLSSLVKIGPQQEIKILHASLTDFLLDPTHSKEFWINPRFRHTLFACRCLQLLQCTSK